jgi:hypothetical protein
MFPGGNCIEVLGVKTRGGGPRMYRLGVVGGLRATFTYVSRLVARDGGSRFDGPGVIDRQIAYSHGAGV